MPNQTLFDIDEKVRRAMVIESDSTTYDRSDVRIPKINSVVQNICKWRYKDITSSPNNPVIYQWGDMIFLRKPIPYVVNTPLPTTDVVLVDAESIPISNTEWYTASWAVIINNNIIPYTSLTPTSFEGTSNILAQIPSGATVHQLYTLPDDYHKPFLMKYVGNTWNNNIDFKDFRDPQAGFTNYYVLWDSDVGQYLYIVGDVGTYWFYYYKSVSDMVDDDDECVIPDSYPVDMVALIVAWELLYEVWLEDEAMRKLTIWYSKLQVFYSEYAETTKDQRQTVNFKKTQTCIINTQIW